MNKRYFFLLFFLFILGAFYTQAQNRMPDSMRVKQEKYNLEMKTKAKRQRDSLELAKYKQSTAAVISYDSKGNKVEEVKKSDGTTVITTTIKKPPILNRKFSMDSINVDSVFLKVVKSKNRLFVYHKGQILTAYKCVFGPNWEGQKLQEGDRKTPEGIFTINDVRKHEKWEYFMLLDFPNDESRKNFELAKQKGLVSENARIGGNIGIHGIWFNGDNVIDLKHNWTDGCISIKNADVQELAKLVKPGYTKISILK